MNKGTRKLMTMHKTLCLRDDIYRLYVSRKEGGRALKIASIHQQDVLKTTQKREKKD